MSRYHHLTLVEREKILYYRAQGVSISSIAIILNRNKSTISRELARNNTPTGDMPYLPSDAQRSYQQRRERCRPVKRLETQWLYQYVTTKLFSEQWSPEQIAGRLTRERRKKIISYSTIYRAIYAGVLNPTDSHTNKQAVRALRHHGKTRHRKNHVETRGKITITNDIEQRPKGAVNRSRRGHWEADTVAGKQGKACLVTLTDRKTRYLVGGKAQAKKAADVANTMIQALQHQPVKTITPDRGKEFAHHPHVTDTLGTPFYFPQPHQPWQRGTNENTNGLIRQYLPKGKDLTNTSEKDIQTIFDKLNRRPRKTLNWKTPYEAHYDTTLHLT